MSWLLAWLLFNVAFAVWRILVASAHEAERQPGPPTSMADAISRNAARDGVPIPARDRFVPSTLIGDGRSDPPDLCQPRRNHAAVSVGGAHWTN